MSKNQIVFISGIILLATPFFGVPGLWKTIVYVSIAFLLIATSTIERIYSFLVDQSDKTGADSYTENRDSIYSQSDETNSSV